MNKRASFLISGEMLVWLFRMGILILVLVIFAVMVGIFVNKEVDTSVVEHKVIIDKIFLQQGCINYYDGIKWRTYSIDIKKFNIENLDKCYQSKDLGLDLGLEYNNINLGVKYNDRILGYTNLCEGRQYSCSRGKFLVKVLDNGREYDGIISYEVITRNE